jgi:hypothetical protein
VTAHPSYQHVYPLSDPEAVQNLAYYFVFDYAQPQDVGSYTRSLSAELGRWRAVHADSDLFSVDCGEHLLIWDLRPVAAQPLTVLDGLARRLYLECDRARTITHLADTLAADGPGASAEVATLLQPLIDRRLMIQDGNLLLSLAVPLGNYVPKPGVLAKFRGVLRALGTERDGETQIDLIGHGRVIAAARTDRPPVPSKEAPCPSPAAAAQASDAS